MVTPGRLRGGIVSVALLAVMGVLAGALMAPRAHAQPVVSAGSKRLAIETVNVSPDALQNVKATDRKAGWDPVLGEFTTLLRKALVAGNRFEIAPGSGDNASTDYRLAFSVVSVPATAGRNQNQAFAGTMTISDAKTKEVMGSSKVALTPEALRALRGKPGQSTDSREVAREWTAALAEIVARRAADVVYPARVIGKRGKAVTVARGEGSGIAVGQVWEIFGIGEEKKDPDTGATLPREETVLGRVQVTRVLETAAEAAVLLDKGIDRGAVARPEGAPAPRPTEAK